MAGGRRAAARSGGVGVRRGAGLRAGFGRAANADRNARRRARRAVRVPARAAARADAFGAQGRSPGAAATHADEPRVDLPARTRPRPRLGAGTGQGRVGGARGPRRARRRRPAAVAGVGRARDGSHAARGSGAAVHRRRASPLRDRSCLRTGASRGRSSAVVHRVGGRSRAHDSPHAPHRFRPGTRPRQARHRLARVVRGGAGGPLHGSGRAARRARARADGLHRRVPRRVRRQPRAQARRAPGRPGTRPDTRGSVARCGARRGAGRPADLRRRHRHSVHRLHTASARGLRGRPQRPGGGSRAPQSHEGRAGVRRGGRG